MNKDEIKSCKQLANKKVSLGLPSLVTISSQIKDCARGKMVASTAITTTLTTTVVNTNVQP